MTITYTCERIPSRFGEVGLVWEAVRNGADPVVSRILLPVEGVDTGEMIRAAYPGSVERAPAAAGFLGRRIRRFLEGAAVDFSPDELNLQALGAFQQRVLRLQSQIPRGRVGTYGALAVMLGCPRAARAVGTALARNPFPLVIPCHRTIRTGGALGGFGGGLKMKRALLEMEGVGFDRRGRVREDYFRP